MITRTAQDEAGAWDKVKPAADLNKLKTAGKFLDLWQWRAARSNAVGYASDDWVMEYRNGDAGGLPGVRRGRRAALRPLADAAPQTPDDRRRDPPQDRQPDRNEQHEREREQDEIEVAEDGHG